MTNSVGYSGRIRGERRECSIRRKKQAPTSVARSNFYPGSLLTPFDRRLSVGATGSTTES